MLKKQSQVFLTLLFFADLIMVGINWNLAYFIRFFWFNYPPVDFIPNYRVYLRATLIVLLIASFCFIYAKMYHPKRISRFRAELRSIFKSNLFLIILLLGLTFFYRGFSFSRIHMVYFLSISLLNNILFRLIVRLVLSFMRRHGKNLRRILVIGAGKTSVNFINKVRENESLGFIITGYAAQRPSEVMLDTAYLGDYDKLPRIIEELDIDQIYVTLDSEHQSDMKIINHNLAEQMVDLHIVPDIYNTLNINPEILDFDGIPIIAIRQSPIGGWNRVLKRLFDIFGAIVAIIILLPLWILLPILIKLTSPGPVFYSQVRMGLDGCSFHMLKFRSMRIGAEEKTGAVWAKKEDDRRTKLGTFMRKTSLDEIPQLFNVLTGTMSLVGPRPERPVFIKDFKSQIPNYMLRHKMKAGITGWAQINGWRGNTSLEKRIEFDIYYLTNWSIWFDIKILILTLIKGFINPNAY
ncbi:MAG: undecaprenyl-phosphate glucose phosphotransferase [Deltaproteobacteria bacterium]|nr:undecaprenyl-phosphate glucose phosphotransferase [Deltaproteobacteria bacterium]